MLNIENVSKRYGKTLANDGVSFAVAGGELAVLLGPNGAGKSTLIKCVAGLLRFEGEIRICGPRQQDAGGQARAGLHPGNAGGVRPLTVSEHLEFMRRAWRMEDDGLRRGAASPLRDVGQARTNWGKELSKGMQQKLSICCQLVHTNPRVVISTSRWSASTPRPSRN